MFLLSRETICFTKTESVKCIFSGRQQAIRLHYWLSRGKNRESDTSNCFVLTMIMSECQVVSGSYFVSKS